MFLVPEGLPQHCSMEMQAPHSLQPPGNGTSDVTLLEDVGPPSTTSHHFIAPGAISPTPIHQSRTTQIGK